MLYIKVKKVNPDGSQTLKRVCRFRNNATMNGVFDFTDEVAAAIFTTGETVASGHRYVMGHTLPAQEMAEATTPFFMLLEKEDGTVVQHLVTPHGVPS